MVFHRKAFVELNKHTSVTKHFSEMTQLIYRGEKLNIRYLGNCFDWGRNKPAVLGSLEYDQRQKANLEFSTKKRNGNLVLKGLPLNPI